jgi:hypothetical protein
MGLVAITGAPFTLAHLPSLPNHPSSTQRDVFIFHFFSKIYDGFKNFQKLPLTGV